LRIGRCRISSEGSFSTTFHKPIPGLVIGPAGNGFYRRYFGLFTDPKDALMHNFRVFHAKRIALGLSVIGAMTFAGGCGDTETAGPAAVATSKANEERERTARQNAFGGTGNPGKPAAPKPAEPAKP
jgi:hypothetical protein